MVVIGLRSTLNTNRDTNQVIIYKSSFPINLNYSIGPSLDPRPALLRGPGAAGGGIRRGARRGARLSVPPGMRARPLLLLLPGAEVRCAQMQRLLQKNLLWFSKI